MSVPWDIIFWAHRRLLHTKYNSSKNQRSVRQFVDDPICRLQRKRRIITLVLNDTSNLRPTLRADHCVPANLWLYRYSLLAPIIYAYSRGSNNCFKYDLKMIFMNANMLFAIWNASKFAYFQKEMLILFAFILENAYLFAHGNANLFDYSF